MVITAHFVDASWELKKLIIGFKNIYYHKGKAISKVLLDFLAEWYIKRVFCITVDNATTNSSAIRRFKEEFNTLGDDALVLKGKEVDDSVNAILNGIYFVRSSTPRLNSFELHVESGRVQKGSLPLDVLARWNSTFLMLEQAMKFRFSFEKMTVHDKPYNYYFNEKVNGRKRTGPPVKSDWEELDSGRRIIVCYIKGYSKRCIYRNLRNDTSFTPNVHRRRERERRRECNDGSDWKYDVRKRLHRSHGRQQILASERTCTTRRSKGRLHCNHYLAITCHEETCEEGSFNDRESHSHQFKRNMSMLQSSSSAENLCLRNGFFVKNDVGISKTNRLSQNSLFCAV